MIPVLLKLENFVSWKATTIDFRGFDSACLAGDNGQGKSSLLEAIPFALYGQAQGASKLITDGTDRASVTLIFQLDEQHYRIIREIKRSGTAPLRFESIRNDSGDDPLTVEGKSLAGNGLGETNKAIAQLLQLDAEAFKTSAFLKQDDGADFILATPTVRRKRLRSVLGLEVWDKRLDIAKDQSKTFQSEVRYLHQTLTADLELAQEIPTLEEASVEATKAEVLAKTLADELAATVVTVRAEADAYQQLNVKLSTLREAKVELLKAQAQDEAELKMQTTLLEAAADIRARSEEFAILSTEVIELDRKLQEFTKLREISTQIRSELSAHEVQCDQHLKNLDNQIAGFEHDLKQRITTVEKLRLTLEPAATLDEQIHSLEPKREIELKKYTDATAQRAVAITTADQAQLRLKVLGDKAGPCPLCDGPLTPAERKRLTAQTTKQIRDAETTATSLNEQIKKIEASGKALASELEELKTRSSEMQQTATRITTQETEIARVRKDISELMQVREKSATQFDTELKVLRARLQESESNQQGVGYDEQRHTFVRLRLSSDLRNVADETARLNSAESITASCRGRLEATASALQRASIEAEAHEAELAGIDNRYPQTVSKALELTLLESQNAQQAHHVALEKRVKAVGELDRAQKAELSAAETLKQIALQTSQREIYDQLCKAFEAIPHRILTERLITIERKANEFLQHLTNGDKTVEFETTRARADSLEPALNVTVRDDGFPRDFDRLSGGEQHRVAIAVRLALSDALASRHGAHLDTLVIDEGFGSQDPQGRQMLIDLLVTASQNTFRKVLVVSHIEDVQESFDVRIEVTKDPLKGSIANVARS